MSYCQAVIRCRCKEVVVRRSYIAYPPSSYCRLVSRHDATIKSGKSCLPEDVADARVYCKGKGLY